MDNTNREVEAHVIGEHVLIKVKDSRTGDTLTEQVVLHPGCSFSQIVWVSDAARVLEVVAQAKSVE